MSSDNQAPISRERRMARAFVELADTLVDDFDPVDLLATLAERCVDLLGVAAAGILLADQRGGLRVAAASSEAARLIELFELQSNEGPCRDCYASGEPAYSQDLAADVGRWPRFAQRAREGGFASVSALPLRLRGEVIGALNLFYDASPGLDPLDHYVGQAFADVATIGILQERAIRRGEQLTEQLQRALNSRAVIEQAKGVLVATATSPMGMDEAFTALRAYARSQHLRLTELATAVVERHADIAGILNAHFTK
ncbi:MAG TPA: GAF and ANTAR domain-containing protein [Mycobacteriales bacterium]|nr:GAF and ANTAR domain-containing protein [Mycobacteriales bacterium]